MQAHLQALIIEVQNLKNEIRNYMSTTELEKQNLEAHVDLCEQRYKNLETRLSKIEEKVESIHEDIHSGNKSMVKVIIGATGTIVAGLLSTIVVLLLKFPG